MQIAEFFAKIGFKIDDKDLKTFQQGIEKLTTSMGEITTAAAGTIYGFSKFIDSVNNGAVRLRNFTMQTGQSAQDLQDLDAQLRLSDFTAKAGDAEQMVRSLGSALQQLQFSGANANIFKYLGVTDLSQSPKGIIDQMRQFYQTTHPNPQLYSSFLGQIGLPPNFINLLNAKKADYDKFVKETGFAVLTPEEIERSNQTTASLKGLGVAWDNFVDHIMASQGVQDVLNNVLKIFGGLSEVTKGLAEGFNSLDSSGGLSDFVKEMGAALLVAVPFLATITAISKALGLLGIGGAATAATEATAAVRGLGTEIAVVNTGILGLSKGLSTLGALAAILYAIQHFSDIKSFTKKNDLYESYNPFYWLGRAGVAAIYGKDSPEYKRLEAQYNKNGGAPISPLWGSSGGGSPAPAGGNDNGDFPKFGLLGNRKLQPLDSSTFLPPAAVSPQRGDLNSTQSNSMNVTIHNAEPGTDYNAIGNMWAGQVGKGTNIILEAYEQQMNGGF